MSMDFFQWIYKSKKKKKLKLENFLQQKKNKEKQKKTNHDNYTPPHPKSRANYQLPPSKFDNHISSQLFEDIALWSPRALSTTK